MNYIAAKVWGSVVVWQCIKKYVSEWISNCIHCRYYVVKLQLSKTGEDATLLLTCM
jgi:hypothetical protein